MRRRSCQTKGNLQSTTATSSGMFPSPLHNALRKHSRVCPGMFSFAVVSHHEIVRAQTKPRVNQGRLPPLWLHISSFALYLPPPCQGLLFSNVGSGEPHKGLHIAVPSKVCLPYPPLQPERQSKQNQQRMGASDRSIGTPKTAVVYGRLEGHGIPNDRAEKNPQTYWNVLLCAKPGSN